MNFRIAALAALSSLPFAALAAPLAVTTVEGEIVPLSTRIHSSGTLALVVRSEPELQETFRLLSFAESRGLHCLALVELPADRPAQSAALKRAARRFLTSEFGRQRVAFIEAGELPGSKAALLRFDADEPIWTSPSYPDDAKITELSKRAL